MRLRAAVAIVALAGCRKAPTPPAPVVHDPPPARASAAAGPPARPAATDGGVCSATLDDVVARFRAWCREEICHQPTDTDEHVLEVIGRGRPVGDIDGDGVADVGFSWGPMPMTDQTHLYSGAKCGAYLGEVGGDGTIKVLATRHEGMADLEVEDNAACEGASCGCTMGRAVFVRRAGRYEEDKSQTVASTIKPCP